MDWRTMLWKDRERRRVKKTHRECRNLEFIGEGRARCRKSKKRVRDIDDCCEQPE